VRSLRAAAAGSDPTATVHRQRAGERPVHVTSAVALPRWVVGLLVGACGVCLVAVAFLLGRVTAPPAPAGASETSRDLQPSSVPEGGEAVSRALAPSPSAGGNPDTAAVAAYFARMDAVAARVKAAQDPEALARTILDQTLSGDMTGIEGLITTQRTLQARMAEVVPPRSCREHHQRSLRLMGRAIALLERTRDALAGKSPSDLAGVATEGRAIEEEARATDALANDLRRAAGLPLAP